MSSGGSGVPTGTPPQVDLSDCGDLSLYDQVIYGTPGDDTLAAGMGRQVLVGLGGDDVISGGAGDDCLVGGRGDDQLTGDGGADVVAAGAGTDELDAGNDSGDTCVDTDLGDDVQSCGATDEAEGADAQTTPPSSESGASGQDAGDERDGEAVPSPGPLAATNDAGPDPTAPPERLTSAPSQTPAPAPTE